MIRDKAPREVVKLIHPILGHEKITEYTLRQPTAADILPIGFPQDWQPTGDGGAVFVTNNAAIAQYAERLVVGVDTVGLFAVMSVEDTMVLQRKIVDFFRVDVKTKSASESSSTGSSTDSDGDPPKSTN